MEQLERPDEITWDERRLWFEETEGRLAAGGARRLSEQATALAVDLQACFCAGAWSAVVILAATIAEAQLRVAQDLPEGLAGNDLRWLRRLRNLLVHEDPKAPVLTLEQQWTGRSQWEKDARRAVVTALTLCYRAAGEEKS